MIGAIQRLGEYSLRNQNISIDKLDDTISILIENPASNESYKKVLKIKVNLDEGKYSGIEIDEYDSLKLKKYLYRKGSPRGTDYSPTSRITEPEKTFLIKTLKWFQKEYPEAKLVPNEINQLQEVCEVLENNRDKIVEELEKIYIDVKKEKQNAILTVELVIDNKKLLPGDIHGFKKIFLMNSTSTYYDKYSKTSKSSKNVCSVCGKQKEVYGFVSTYAFYTVDKPGMVSGGFNQSDAWKNYPVCEKCALILEQGKQWLEKYSSYNFYGFDYLLIPKPLLDTYNDDIYESLKYYQEDGTQVRVTGRYGALLDATQDEILPLLAEKENIFHCNMLIYRASKSEFKILRYIEGIYPSDLKRLFDAKYSVDEKQFIKKTNVPFWENRKKAGEKDLEFDFGCFWYFLRDENQSKYFLDIVYNVFKDKKINKQFLLNRVIKKIRENHVNGYNIEEPVMRGFSCLLYLEYLGLLKYNESEKMSKKIRTLFQTENSTRVQAAEKIFKEYPDFFKNDPEKAVFIVGVLSQLLMNIQYRERKATPFKAKLQGLRLDEKKVKSLLPEIQNKLEEYDSNYYRDLETLASEYFIQAQNDWRLSRDEISFYFALGMNLSKYFRTEKEEKEDE
jgi:CRISPR-associated protein Csh1